MRHFAPLALLLLAAGCGVPEEGPWMDPGADCLACHSSSGQAREVPWNAAGTLFSSKSASAGLAGATIEISDAHGSVVSLTTNGAGNFYTKEALVFPIRAALVVGGQRREMEDPVPTGSCNSCHTAGGEADAPLSPD